MFKLGGLFGRAPASSAAADAKGVAPPALPLDFSAPAMVADPVPAYAWLRANTPVAELAGGGFVLTRHSDIKAAFTDKRLGNAPSRFSTLAPRNADKYVAADLAAHIPPFLDGDAHRAPRQMLSRAFFNVFNGFEGDLQALAEERTTQLNAGDDLIASGAQPFALQVMCRFCGIKSTPEQMKPLTQAFFHLFAPLRDPDAFAEVNAALGKFRDVIGAALDAGPPEGSFLAEAQAWQHANDGTSRAHVIDGCLLVFADGVENIEAGAASLLALFAREGALEAIAAGEVPLEAAIREGLRLETPAQLVPRVAKQAFEMHGQVIGKDMPVFLALASANRDPEVFADADLFDPARDFADTVTFGLGRHACIGAPLAMAQLSAFLQAVMDRGLRPDPAHALRYQTRVGHRWPAALPLIKAQ